MMANQITGDPNEYDFGLDFDYAVWSANTHITLTNVPWNNDYRDVVSFASTDALNTYIDKSMSANVSISNASYAKVNEPISIDLPFNVANRFNYVRVYNPAQPVRQNSDVPRYFYYFITDVRYIAPNTTSITVQLDVWQTYIRLVTFGRCFVERGHLGIANEHNFRNYGRDYLTVPEGLDVGSNYMVVDSIRRPIMAKNDRGNIGGARVGSSILVCATVDLEVNPGTKENPNLDSAKGGQALGIVSGAEFYLFKTVNDFQNFIRNYAKYPWKTQGITSITIIPDYRRYWADAHLGARLSFGGYRAPAVNPAAPQFFLDVGGFRNRANVLNYIPPRYRNLRKFWTFPYMAIRIASNAGQQVILQPELWNSDTGHLVEMSNMMPPNARIGIIPKYYNTTTRSAPTDVIAGDGFDRMVSVSGLPTVPIVNNGAILAMANSAHSTAFGHQSADWSQQRALRGNETSYDQSTMGMNAASDQARIQANADIASTSISNQLAQDSAWMNAIGGAASSAAGGLVGGPLGAGVGLVSGAAGGAMNLLNTGMQIDASNAQLANRLSSAAQSQQVASGLAGGVRDTNKNLADWAARGDYENTIAGLNAKTRDAELTPPSVSGQMGGELFNYQNGQMEFRFEFLMPDQATIQNIGEYWLRYGYGVNRFTFLPNNLMTMTRFTYWKLKETYIRSAGMPETFKQAIRGVLEKGVTVWANPEDIGVIDTADNAPVPGIVIDGYVPPTPEPDPDPEPPVIIKRKKKKMIVFSSIDDNPATPGPVWALAGTSPGTDANWIETRDAGRADAFLAACGVDDPVGVAWVDFETYRDLYRGPVATLDATPSEA